MQKIMFFGIIHLSVSVKHFFLVGGMVFCITHFLEGESEADTHHGKLIVIVMYDIDGASDG